jgi:hypothetical protein
VELGGMSALSLLELSRETQGAKTGAVMLFLETAETVEALTAISAGSVAFFDIVRHIRLREPSVNVSMFEPSVVSV